MSKVMFFAHDPGGANAICPLISQFPNALVFGKGPALSILPNAVPLPENAISIHKPDFLITGTSQVDLTENGLWKNAADCKVKSMAILDHWMNYRSRFSLCFPTYICVMDDFAKEEMKKEGVPEQIILPLGNPHFERVASVKGKIKVLFASSMENCELQVMEELISIANENKNLEIRYRKHPREVGERYLKFLDNGVILDSYPNSLDAIFNSDIVVGTGSMLLLEALILGKRSICYDGGGGIVRNFILIKNKTLPFIDNFEDFKKQIVPTRSNGIVKGIATFLEGEING